MGTKIGRLVQPQTIAVARVLRRYGLVQGTDFRVRGRYQRGERIGTHVVVLTSEAEMVIAEHADRIEQDTDHTGYGFRVSVHYTAGGRLRTWVANYGQRTRDDAPVATADQDGPVLDTASRKLATDLLTVLDGIDVKDLMISGSSEQLSGRLSIRDPEPWLDLPRRTDPHF